MQVEVARVLTPERDEITRKGHVVTDKNSETDSQLQSQAFVIRGPDTDRGAAFLIHLVIRIQHTKQLCLLYRELLLHDVDTPCLELAFEGLHQVVVSDRRPRVSWCWGLKQSETFTVDILCTNVSNEASSHDGFSFL
jgi:hypothetical protein